MKVLIIISLIVFASAQREFYSVDAFNTNPEIEQDAEVNDPAPEFPFFREGTFLPDNESDNVNVNKTYRPTIFEIIIGRPMHTPFLFPWGSMGPMRPIFPQRPLFDFGFDDEYDDSNRTSDDFFPDYLEDPKLKDLPPNYENSTYEVKDINGTKFHVNQTIEKKSGDGFNSYFHVKVVKVVPDNSTLQERPFQEFPEETIPKEEETILKEETIPKEETEPEFEIPKNYDESLNQLDSKKPFRDDENIEVRRGERTKRSSQSLQLSNTMNSYEADVDHSRFEGHDFYPQLTNEKSRFVLRRKGSNPEKNFRKNFVLKNMDGINYAYNLLNNQYDPENRYSVENMNPVYEKPFGVPNLPIDIADNIPFKPYSRYANEYGNGLNFVNSIPYGTKYDYGPLVPNMRINPEIYQNFPTEMNYDNIPYNDFPNTPTNFAGRKTERNRNVIYEAPQPVTPRKKVVRLIEVVSVPKPLFRSGLSLGKGKPIASKYILIPIKHQEPAKESSSYFKHSEDKSKENNYSENDVETIMVIRPPDLSSDTRVNRVAAARSDSQQGLVQVDPDVEVFDLSLVLKELQIHD